jgi:signal transduction histidine kinase/CheY-like chemotaxis protein/HPt (histidine-containing phosphotransfer) domain-containing protein
MLEYRSDRVGYLQRTPYGAPEAELPRRSLSGRPGVYVGPDARGAEVVAAYQTVGELGWGVVAKKDLVEIRAPFVKAGQISALLALVGLLIGVRLIIRANNVLIRRIEQAREFAEDLVQKLITPAFVIGPDHRVLVWNRACEELTGVKAAEVVGTTDHWRGFYREQRPCLADVVIDGDAERAIGLYQELAGSDRSAGALRAENWCDLPKTGSRHYLLIDAGPIRDDAGNLVAVVETLRDVTEAKHLAEELMETRDAALSASRTKSQFLANMSHEIRTPMNGVLGMLDLLRDTRLDPQQRELADTAHQSAENLLEIINDILDISKIEAGRLDLEHVDMDLRSIVDDVCAILSRRAHDKGLEFTCLMPIDLPARLRGDPTRLRQILMNLVGNAIKFTDRGQVDLRVSAIGAEAGRVRLRFEIQDTGIGISAEAQQRLFKAFSQADGSTTRRFGGTGLGLAICKQLVEMMHGEIGIDSAAGSGSTFWFTAWLDRQEGALGPEQVPADLHGHKILIVDDNDTNRRILEHYVESWGMRHESAESGILALAQLRAAVDRGEPFDTAILDMQIPGMDGCELSRRIGDDPTLQPVRRVLLSSIDRLEPDSLRRCGIEIWLHKPARPSQLYDALANLHARQPEAVAVAAEPPAGPVSAPGVWACARVLLVEDNVVNQKVAGGILKLFGIVPAIADNGSEAVEMSGRERFDLILMDCQMPVLDGFEATSAIRARETESGGHVPIVAMTANAMHGDRERCLEAGMDDYLAKPVNKVALEKVLRHWLAGASAGEELVDRKSEIGAAATVESSATVAIDTQTLGSLGELMGADFVGLLDNYIADAERLLTQMRVAIDQGDPAQLRMAAHTLKSSSASVGAKPFSEIARQLEVLGRDGRADAGAELLQQAEMEFPRVRAALRGHMTETTRAA